MVCRLSVASLDSGAESPVYGEEPSASADRDPAAKPPWAGGGGRRAVWPMRVVFWAAILIIGYRVTAILFDETPSSGSGNGNDATGTAASGFPVAHPGENGQPMELGVPLYAPDGGLVVTVNRAIPWQVGTGVPRLATTYDMSVVDQQSGRWYVKDIRASTQPMGTP
jgi:hypothetical protein